LVSAAAPHRWLGTALLLVSLASGWDLAAEIGALQVSNSDRRFRVAFRLNGAFTPEVEEVLASGLPITFRHTLRAYRRRAAWLDRLISEQRVDTTAQLDTLTRQYRLSRAVDGQMVDTRLTDKPEEMKAWMTSVEGLELPWQGNVDPADLLYVKVKSEIQKRFVFFFIPWDFETSWARSAPLAAEHVVQP
jgi:hypothetical protein